MIERSQKEDIANVEVVDLLRRARPPFGRVFIAAIGPRDLQEAPEAAEQNKRSPSLGCAVDSVPDSGAEDDCRPIMLRNAPSNGFTLGPVAASV